MRLSRRMANHSAVGGAVEVTYTGNYTDTEITVGGKKKRLLTFTGSGTLTLSKEVSGQIWLCNGGDSGITSSAGGYGGRGASFRPTTDITLGTELIVVTVGAGGASSYTADKVTGGSTAFDSYVATTKGSGGGTGGTCTAEGKTNGDISGGRVSTIPFSDSTNFAPHCAGGGGGGYFKIYVGYQGYPSYSGGAGGTDGANGSGTSGFTSAESNYTISGTTYKNSADGGVGGTKGGGTGGKAYYSSGSVSAKNGSNATYYGSSGGGGGYYLNVTVGGANYKGGNGYQGIVYLLLDAA